MTTPKTSGGTKAALLGLLFAAPLMAGVVWRGSTPPAPHATVSRAVEALRDDDLAAFLEFALTPDERAELAASWDRDRSSELDPEEEFGFNVALQMFVAEGAEDALFAQVEPELAAFREQASLFSSLAVGMAGEGIASEPSLSTEQKEDAGVVLERLGTLLTEDLGDPVKARRVVELTCEALRASGVGSYRDLRALSFDELVERAGPLLATVKEVLLLYGVDLDAWLDSVEATTLYVDGERAAVNVRYTVLGETQETRVELKNADGRWITTRE